MTPIPHPTVHLRALEPEDLSLLYTIENDRNLWSVSNTSAPYSRYALRNYISQACGDIYKDGTLRLIIETAEQKSVGIIDILSLDANDLRAEIGIAILEEERRKGYARAAITEVERYCRETLHLNMVYSEIAAHNAPCRRLFESLDYHLTAELPGWYFKSGAYRSKCIYQKFFPNLRQNFLPQRK